MSDKTLSQRLRELKSMCIAQGERHSIPNETAHWLIVGAVDEIDQCIAQAEALEAQAGELIDDFPPIPSMQEVVDNCEAQPLAYPTLKEYTEHLADKFAHELAASQAIGEQTPIPDGEIHGLTLATQDWIIGVLMGITRSGSLDPIMDLTKRLRERTVKDMPADARDLAIEALAKLRNYFGENDRTPHEQYLFSVADQSLSALRS